MGPLQIDTLEREGYETINLARSIPAGGFFWTSGFPVVEREVGADHLPKAAALRLETLTYLNTHFKPVTAFNLPGFLFRKK
jgi:hypothetical protein